MGKCLCISGQNSWLCDQRLLQRMITTAALQRVMTTPGGIKKRACSTHLSVQLFFFSMENSHALNKHSNQAVSDTVCVILCSWMWGHEMYYITAKHLCSLKASFSCDTSQWTKVVFCSSITYMHWSETRFHNYSWEEYNVKVLQCTAFNIRPQTDTF